MLLNARPHFSFRIWLPLIICVLVLVHLRLRANDYELHRWTPYRTRIPLDQDEQFQDRFASFLDSIGQANPLFSSLKQDDRPIEIGIRELAEGAEGIERRNITHLSDADILASKDAHSLVVHSLPQYEDLVTYNSHSRGIVTVGGGRFTPMALVSVLMLRRTKSNMPVEVFLPDETDYDEHTCEVIFKDLNARCLVLSRFTKVPIAKYQYKVFAILFSSFEDVIFLDADSFPVIDPSKLFSQEPYTSTGLVTWPDFWISSATHLFYEITNQPTPDLHEHASSESGQILISKRKHGKSLLLALYYNFHGPAFYYKLLSQKAAGEGDKETWIAAATALNNTYYQVREGTQPVGRHLNGTYRYGGMLQYNPHDDYKRQQKNKVPFRESEHPQGVFFHLNGAKPNPQDWLNNQHGLRLWGPVSEMMRRFGRDLELEIWEEIIFMACQLGKSMSCLKDSAVLCDKLNKSWETIVSAEKVDV
jgi:alpha 1,2-mannosyltransferase